MTDIRNLVIGPPRSTFTHYQFLHHLERLVNLEVGYLLSITFKASGWSVLACRMPGCEKSTDHGDKERHLPHGMTDSAGLAKQLTLA